MEITGNRSALIALFETAANEVHAGRPETIAEAIEAYQIFRDTLSHTKFTDGEILDALSNLKNEWSAFLSREPNADAGDVTDAHNAVSEIHKAIEKSLRGMADCEISKSALDTLRRAATAVASERNAFKHELDKLDRNRFKPMLDNTNAIKNKVDPFDRYAGLEKVSEARRPLVRAAIDYCYEQQISIVRIGDKPKPGQLRLSDFAKVVWNLPENANKQSGFSNLKDFQTAINEQAHRNARSFRWIAEADQSSNL